MNSRDAYRRPRAVAERTHDEVVHLTKWWSLTRYYLTGPNMGNSDNSIQEPYMPGFSGSNE